MLKNTIGIIKDRVSITSIVSERVKLKRVGSRLIGLCPFHKEKSPSFSVNEQGRFYYCFGCGEGGDVIDFLSKSSGLSLNEALERLAPLAGIEFKKDKDAEILHKLEVLLGKLRIFFHECLYYKSGEDARRYISNRVSDPIIKKFQLGYCNPSLVSRFFRDNKIPNDILKKSGVTDQNNRCYFNGRITFPILNKYDKTIAFGSRVIDGHRSPKYLNSSETALFKKNEVLYSINLAKDFCKERLIVAEGYMDVITLHQYGFKNSVGILGTSVTSKHLEKLFDLTKEVVFCFDGDSPGFKAATRTIQIILSEFIHAMNTRVQFIFLPGGKDPADILTESKETFEFLLDRSLALSKSIFYLNSVDHEFSIPEDYLLLEKRLDNFICVIKDYSTKKHFRDFFKQEIFKLKNQKKRSSVNHHSLIVRASSTHQEILLFLALRFPEILNSGYEQEYFALLDFKSEYLGQIHQHIMNFINMNDDLCFKNLESYFLKNDKLSAMYQNFLKDNRHDHIGDMDNATKLWRKVTKEIEVAELQNAYKESLKKSLSDNSALDVANSILARINKIRALM